MKEKLQKKLIVPLAALAIVGIGGSVYTLSYSGPTTAHAQTPTIQVQQKNDTNSGSGEVKDAVNQETPDTATTEAGKEINDGPGGHQDPTGTNTNHQFEGKE